MSLRYLWSLCGCVLLAGAAAPIGAARESGDDLEARIDRLAQPLIESKTVVGMTIGVVRGDERIVRGYGRVSMNDDRAPDGRTVYEIGSATKAFTGILLAEMAERGEVKLNDPANDYLPRGVRLPSEDETAITLEHLATHSSGLPRLPDNMAPADPANPYADYTVKQMYAFLKEAKLNHPPGESVDYSNLGMGLLGHLLAREAGQSYEQLITERLLRPLQMSDTAIALTPSMRSRLAPPYAAFGQPAKNWDLPTLAGAGALRSTARDMLKFIEANLEASADADSPLSRAMADAHRRRKLTPQGGGIGLGWHIARDGQTRWHNGQTGGYHSMVMLSPRIDAGVVVLANTATPHVDTLGQQIMQVLNGMDVEPMQLEQQKEMTVDPATLKRYVGTYQLAPDFALTVDLENDQLMVRATGQQKFPIFAESPTRFFYRVVDAQLTFQVDGQGKVTGLILHQNGRNMPARKVR